MPPLSRFLLPFSYAKERYAGHPLRLSIAALKTIFVFHVFWQYGYAIAPLEGPSMLPTFEVKGDSVIISRYYRRGRNVKVGDVVQFDSVVEPGEGVIKRVLGLQGDYVMRDTPGSTDSMIQVPDGHCWVIGDNLPWSRDSRHFGPMPMGLIKGKVIAKVLPWSERKWIENGLQPIEKQ
ncbi:signal peptidase-like protein I [Hyaloscypha variabilis F]|uniref:Signal peptidase-like protein I n=1 Tax=Hyaloscypha variabilis (strain UAMH 11265 / GT02V1 / F) TaxID=1149755 RepID=A0A2J6S612_HYAVF|nr:signal peptidase-like protein I [Hyaloscypha variabilis F]